MNRRTFFKGWAVTIAAVLLGSKSLASTVEAPRREKTALELFRPTPTQELVIRSLASGDEVIAIGGHRCGKGVVAAACVAAMATGKPITMRDESQVYLKLNSPTIVLVGYDWRHQRRVIQRLLFDPNPINVTHEENGETRVVACPAMIPLCDLTEIQWQNRKERTMISCVVKSTGVKLVFCSSCDQRYIGGIGAAWVDERIEDDNLYTEILMQLCDTRGKMLWTSYPFLGQPQLVKTVNRIEFRPGSSTVVHLADTF